MTECFFEFLKEQDVKYIRSYNLSLKSTIGIGGECKALLLPKSLGQLIKILEFLVSTKIKFKVLGGMSNVLINDEGFDGIIIKTTNISKYCVAESQIIAECGVMLPRMIFDLSLHSIGGFSELYGIPASIGGAIYNNAGAYGKSIEDVFVSASVYSLSDGKIYEFDKCNMKFSYRESVLKNSPLILLNARFSYELTDEFLIRKRLSDVLGERKTKQPYDKKSLGSVFKRHGGEPISKIIDELGLKGFAIGGAEISKKHAGFIINRENATAEDVKKIIEYVKERVHASRGFVPEEEIEYI